MYFMNHVKKGIASYSFIIWKDILTGFWIDQYEYKHHENVCVVEMSAK